MISMKTRYDIGVTLADIEEAIQNSKRVGDPECDTCAVSIALKRLIPEARNVSTDIQTIRFSLPADRRRLFYLTPSVVQRYIIDFDRADELAAFDFQLRDPAYDIPMRPHRGYEPGAKAKIRTPGGGGTVKVERPAKSVGRLAPTRRTKVRYFGQRGMRINQFDGGTSESGKNDPTLRPLPPT